MGLSSQSGRKAYGLDKVVSFVSFIMDSHQTQWIRIISNIPYQILLTPQFFPNSERRERQTLWGENHEEEDFGVSLTAALIIHSSLVRQSLIMPFSCVILGSLLFSSIHIISIEHKQSSSRSIMQINAGGSRQTRNSEMGGWWRKTRIS